MIDCFQRDRGFLHKTSSVFVSCQMFMRHVLLIYTETFNTNTYKMPVQYVHKQTACCLCQAHTLHLQTPTETTPPLALDTVSPHTIKPAS